MTESERRSVLRYLDGMIRNLGRDKERFLKSRKMFVDALLARGVEYPPQETPTEPISE